MDMGVGFVLNFLVAAEAIVCNRRGVIERLVMKEENEFQQHYHNASEFEQSGARVWNRHSCGYTGARLHRHAGLVRVCASPPDQQRQPKRELHWRSSGPRRRR